MINLDEDMLRALRTFKRTNLGQALVNHIEDIRIVADKEVRSSDDLKIIMRAQGVLRACNNILGIFEDAENEEFS